MAEMNREIWKNTTQSVVYLKGNDPFRDNAFIDIRVGGGETFNISPEERASNQRQIVAKGGDVFTNGMFEPVQLIETAPDIATVAEQPNVRSESEISKMLKLTAAKLKQELAEISSPVLISRILQIAEADEDLPASKMKAIQERKAEIEGEESSFVGYEEQTETGDPIFKKKFLS